MTQSVHDGSAVGKCQGKDCFDLTVIGAGSAGFSAAIRATELGARVALIGHGTIGGTCVNVGCVPSKALMRAMESIYHARKASRFTGIQGDAEITSWASLIHQKAELVASLREAKYSALLPSYEGITYIEGKAELTHDGVIVNGQSLRVKKVIIATGASSAVPPISGIDTIPHLTSTSALELEQLPATLLVVGGGYIGCELAQMFSRAGVKVTLVCRSRLLPHMEPEIGTALTEYYREEGITIRDGLQYISIRESSGGVALEVSVNGVKKVLEAEKVLLTTGRTPNTEGLGLGEAGVECLPNGGIKVDDRQGTTNPDVFAAGDVTGRDMFVYMAAYGAGIAAENALGSGDRRYDATAMPVVVFSDPQAASVGLTEQQAKEQGIEVRSSTLSLEHVPRALAARDTRGLVKLVAEAGTGRLLGAHILAPEGADSIQTAVLAIKTGMTVSELAETIFPYLTTVEGLKLAAQTFDKDVNKLSCCAG